MTDRELLEKAAKAAGYDVQWHPMKPGMREMFWHASHGEWNPLTDDGDALRLAVTLGLVLDLDLDLGEEVSAWLYGDSNSSFTVDASGDPYAATRRAIVRAAAALAT